MVTRPFEQRTLHFALPWVRDGRSVKLHIGRGRHALTEHTAQTRAAARRTNPALRLLPDEQVTHFVSDLQLPADQAQLLFVSVQARRADARLPELLLTKIHTPKKAYRHALAEARARGAIPQGPHPALRAAGAPDDGTDPEMPIHVDDWVSASDAALQAVFQHGELLNIGKDAASAVKTIITYSNGFSDLATAILTQAEEHQQHPANGNWIEEVPYNNPDKTPSSKSRYLWSKTTQQWMVSPIKDSLIKAKNTPALQSSSSNAGNYTVQSGVTAVTSNQTGSDASALATAGPRAAGSDGSWTVNDYTPRHGFEYNNDVALSQGVFSASFTNYWLRWLSGYVEFLGPDGSVVAPQGWTSQVPGGLAATYDSATKKYVALFSSVNTILGIPVDASPTTITFPWPANAAGVRILAGGIGRTGGIEGQDGVYHGGVDPQVCGAGAIMTYIFCFALPTICLAMGAAIPQTELTALAKSVISAALDVGSALINGPLAEGISGGDIASEMIVFADAIPHLLLDAPDLVIAIDAAVAEEAVEESSPIIGWIALGLSVAATVADLAETTVEVSLSPAVFDLLATRAIDAEWTLLPDPHHNEWPLEATHYVVTATYTDGTTRVTSGKMGAPPQTAPITVEFNGANQNRLPAGGTVRFAASFYSDTDWLCGSAASQPLSAAIDADKLAVPQQAITEVLVPLQSSTRYLYQKSLTWDAASGAHAWAAARPTATITSLNPSPVGANIGALGQITVNQPENQLGYSWQASGQDIPGRAGPTDNQLYAFQTVNTLADPEQGLRFVPSGFLGRALVQYGLLAGPSGLNFYLDPSGDLNHLRRIALDASSGTFVFPQTSWGRFNQKQIDACIIHPDGSAIGLNTANAKFEVLKLPSASTVDAKAPLADIFGGYGSRPGLMDQPVGIAPTLGSGVIVLENAQTGLGTPVRMQAFDLRGNPARIFAGQSSTAPVRTEAQPITCLAIATESKGFIYVLKYTGEGSQPDDYLLDIYSPDGAFLAQTAGLPAGGIAVDLWRTLYTLDYQQIAKPQSGRTEPSVSFWTPTTPV